MLQARKVFRKDFCVRVGFKFNFLPIHRCLPSRIFRGSVELVHKLLQLTRQICDTSWDFRLEPADFQRLWQICICQRLNLAALIIPVQRFRPPGDIAQRLKRYIEIAARDRPVILQEIIHTQLRRILAVDQRRAVVAALGIVAVQLDHKLVDHIPRANVLFLINNINTYIF